MTGERDDRAPAEDAATGRTGAARDREILDPDGPCMACGSPNARVYGSPDGPARLCPPCAALNGLGCP